MSFHPDRGGPSPGVPHGQHAPTQDYMRAPPPQPPHPVLPYHYDPRAPPGSAYSHSGYMPPHSDFMQYPPPPPSQTPGPLGPCPPFAKPPGRQGFSDPPPNFPPPPLPGASGGPPPGSQLSAQHAYQPYMMPPVPPPPLQHPPMPPPVASQSMSYHPSYSMNYPPHPPFPPPGFNPGYTQGAGSFNPEPGFRQGGQYKYDKPLDHRRSPERGYRHDDHRQKGYGHGDKHKVDFSGDRKRGRSPDRRGRQDGGRHRSEYDRGRTPPRHRSREWSR